ncbi:NAD-dependent epimerase/dehydratase family protein [Pararobbsia silviterrae]|uniref:NAD-dependent epimerase/dehydratase family protein n=1 Tax=Pararobbsia silviterrae TaxID=1792498 RepID=A0A494Y8Q6_9BURK|nr:NAD-dependent epimerase/dehydratase family protein [Pararobbsia silviterrae]RKP59072.1 NAD-dependent epimerase/dehydratase family protein [Pararobbsia silviterrae]
MNKTDATAVATQDDWSIEADLDAICDATGSAWSALRGARVFITGGTGFIGRWLLESLRHANRRFGLDAKATILTRNPGAFAKKAPELAAYEGFDFVTGDVQTFSFGHEAYNFMIHAATDASAALNEHNPRLMYDTIVNGTHRALEFADHHRAPMLFLSSGAVYGQQPWEMSHVSEDYTGGPKCNDARNTYAEAKRAAEMLCAIFSKQNGVSVVTARIFALLGPFLPLGTHFAAGNFLRDAMDGKPVVVNGNGLPCRSYLYTSDLAAWLWRMLLEGRPGSVYNVGSEESVSVAELAEHVAQRVGTGEFKVLGAADTGWNPGRYVPDISAIQRDLGVTRTVSLDDAIVRTALANGWNRRT